LGSCHTHSKPEPFTSGSAAVMLRQYGKTFCRCGRILCSYKPVVVLLRVACQQHIHLRDTHAFPVLLKVPPVAACRCTLLPHADPKSAITLLSVPTDHALATQTASCHPAPTHGWVNLCPWLCRAAPTRCLCSMGRSHEHCE
jgi:hypothetical protein